MVTINPNETVISGGWELIEGRMVPDATLARIQQLVRDQLEKIADIGGGWETLFRDPADGRFWERINPRSEMHGGGPESLRCIDKNSAECKYHLKL